jgi:hypothetical protein
MRIVILIFLIFSLGCLALPAHADDGDIPPHLGYGIHVGPNTDVDNSLVSQLGMDWVKIYEPGQAYAFPGKRILYRIDLTWPNNWTTFKNDIANRIRGIAGMPIDAVEIGNEPNLISEWGHTPNGWEYVQVLRVAYTVTKSIKPSLIVVSAGLAPTVTTPDRAAVGDLEYAKEMLENGAGQWMDAFGYHPYGYNQPPEAVPSSGQPLVFRRTEQIRAMMEKYGVYKQVWLTEFGWLRDPSEDGVNCDDNNSNFRGFAWLRVSGEQQANYLVRAFQYAHTNWPWAGPMFVWNLNWSKMSWVDMCSHLRWFALLRLNGEPAPAFQKLRAMRHYYSDYQPRLEIAAGQMSANVAMPCLKRTPLGTFSVVNIGYPANITLTVQPVNGADPPFIEAKPTKVKAGDQISLFVNPVGLNAPGQYPLYVNVKAIIGGKPFSRSVEAYVIAGLNFTDC